MPPPTSATPTEAVSSPPRSRVAQLLALPVVRFGIVGGSNYVVSFATFRLVLAIPWQLPAKTAIAQCACYGVGMTWSFFLNKHWTFSSKGDSAKQAARFFALQGMLMVTSALAMGVLVDVGKLNASVTWFVVQGAIIPLNYLLSRNWAFRS